MYSTLAEEFKADGMLISSAKTGASVYRAWISASDWLDSQLDHAHGAKVKETIAFK